MTLSEELALISSIFVDTAPVIYYIEAHPQFGLSCKRSSHSISVRERQILSSVVSLTRGLPKPIEPGRRKAARKIMGNFSSTGKTYYE